MPPKKFNGKKGEDESPSPEKKEKELADVAVTEIAKSAMESVGELNPAKKELSEGEKMMAECKLLLEQNKALFSSSATMVSAQEKINTQLAQNIQLLQQQVMTSMIAA